MEAPVGVPATAIGRLAEADLSTVVMPLGSSSSTAAGIASEVLRALGKNLDANGKARHGLDDVSLVPTWLTAHRTRTLIAAAPQHATIDNLFDLASMCAASPMTLVLAVDHGYATRVVADLRPVLPAVTPWPRITEADEIPATADANDWNPAVPSVLPTPIS
jgi:hypothetical protein